MVITGGWCNTCHGSTAQQQSAFTEYFVPYCRSVRHVPTVKMRVVLFLVCIKKSTISSKHVQLLYTRTSVSYTHLTLPTIYSV